MKSNNCFGRLGIGSLSVQRFCFKLPWDWSYGLGSLLQLECIKRAPTGCFHPVLVLSKRISVRAFQISFFK